VDNGGGQVTFNPSSASGTPTTIDSGVGIEAVACLSSTTCVAVDANGNAIEDDSGTWTLEPISGAVVFSGVACTAGTQCVAVDVSGNMALGTFTPPPAPPTPAPVPVAATPVPATVVVPTTAVVTSAPSSPHAELLKESISSKHHDAEFHFTASGDTTKYECAVVRKPTRKGAKTPKPNYALCGTSKTYKNLKPGKYVFYVRAIGPGGIGVAKDYKFTII
jgi:hypothetical protein